MRQCARTATGSSPWNTAGQCRPHHEDMPPPVSKNQPPLAARRPARVRASEPSRHGYMRTGATATTAGGCGTPGGTPGGTPSPSPSRASGGKGGVAPVLSLTAGAVRVVRSRTKTPNNDGENTMGGVGHPPLRFWYTSPPVCVPFCSTPAVTPIVTPEGSRRRGSIRSPPRGWSAGRWATPKSDRWPRAPSSWWVRPRGAGSSAGTDGARRAAGINGDQRAGRGAQGPDRQRARTRTGPVSAAYRGQSREDHGQGRAVHAGKQAPGHGGRPQEAERAGNFDHT